VGVNFRQEFVVCNFRKHAILGVITLPSPIEMNAVGNNMIPTYRPHFIQLLVNHGPIIITKNLNENNEISRDH